MKRNRMSFTLSLFILLFTHASLSLAQTQWANINGTVTFGGDPLSALILINGQYMFTGNPIGLYDLDVPLDQSGRITIQCFVSGFAPYKEVLTPSGSSITRNIQMQRSSSTRLPLVDLVDITIPTNPDRRMISGYISFNGEPVCSIVIANGQNMFTCDGTGGFELDVPLDANSDITLFCFISGFSTFKVVFDPDTLETPIILDPVLIPLNQRLLGEWSYHYTIISSFENIYLLDTIRENPLSSSDDLPFGVWGTDEYGDPVLAGYYPFMDLYGLLDMGTTLIDLFYMFYFFSDDTVLGCCFQIDKDTDEMSSCYPMTGFKLTDLKDMSSFASKEMLSTSQIEVEEIEMNEAQLFQVNKLKLSTDFSSKFDELAPIVYQEMFDQVREVQ